MIFLYCLKLLPGDDVLDSDNEETVDDDQWEDIEESDDEELMDH